MRVDIVAFLNVLQNVIKVRFHPFCLQFIIPTLGTHLSRCRYEDLQFSIWEDHRTNVSTVHDDSFPCSHALLLCHEGCTDER